MNPWTQRFLVVLASATLGTVLIHPPIASAQSTAEAREKKTSSFGKYEGYSTKEFNSYVRSSRYLTVRDGTRLAVDVMRPARDGKVTDRPLPCIWSHTRYRRATEGPNGRVQCAADSPLTFPLIERGYNIVVVDVRGSGASFGSWQGIFTEEETQDAHEITEWIATQPWCDGNVGMTGASYLGITQLMAASTKPPHLKALFPMVALFDLYSTAYHGGVYFEDFIRTWSELTHRLDTQIIAVGVDEDPGGKLLEEAIAQHGANRALVDVLAPLTYRDSQDPVTKGYPYREWHPLGFIEKINAAGIPTYLWCGWFDAFTKDGFSMVRAFEVPCKITMGAWSHSPRDPRTLQELLPLIVTEQIRWFDHWLKGVDNGIMDEPAIAYHSMIGPHENEWRTTTEWPIAEAVSTPYFFQSGPTNSVRSTNDGLLSREEPSEGPHQDIYTVDYTTTSGTSSRWDNTVGGAFNYSDMTPNDCKSLTYSTAPLPRDVDVTGHPVLHLWVSSTAKDGDFFVFLEEVDGSGKSRYVTEGTLRASHRKLNPPRPEAPFLPWHRGNREDVEDLVPGEPAELVIDLQPTSNVFDAGHRIRLTIACADRDNAQTPRVSPPPKVTVFRNAKLSSYLSLPVVEPP